MSFHERSDPTGDLLRQLPALSPGAEATARVRHRCHAVLARRAAHEAHDSRPGRWQRGLAEAFWLVPLGLYLLISVIETMRVAASL